jgi:uncharacterized protein (TIGR02001 family)
MKKVLLSVAAVLALSAAPAFAADMPVKAVMAPVAAPSPWDVAFGTAFTTDYELRGVSQSNHQPSVNGYFEIDYTATDWLKFYAGLAGESLWSGYGANAEFDIDGGARLSFGNFGLDLGYVYYDYSGSNPNFSFGDFYAKPSYKITDWLTVAGVVDYGNNNGNGVGIIGSKNEGYYAGNAVITLPVPLPYGITTSLNPEVGRQWTDCTGGAACTPDFTYWDVGLDFNYKAITLDFRYWDTDLSHALCTDAVGTVTCDQRFVATLKFDTSLSALK